MICGTLSSWHRASSGFGRRNGLQYGGNDDVRNDLRRMKLRKWSEQAQDRLEWKKIVEKAKTLHEL